MRAVSLLMLLALASAPALAQNAGQSTAQPSASERGQLPEQEQQANDRHNQRVERIVVEDAGSRVDELRVGGRTQSIVVQPKTGGDKPMPAYEVRANDGERAQPGGPDAAGTMTAPRVWNVRKF
jgi:hypothetical protein